MIEAVAELLERMKRGERTGVMLITSGPTGDDETGIYGDFADSLQYAAYSASMGLNTLMKLLAERGNVPKTSIDQATAGATHRAAAVS